MRCVQGAAQGRFADGCSVIPRLGLFGCALVLDAHHHPSLLNGLLAWRQLSSLTGASNHTLFLSSCILGAYSSLLISKSPLNAELLIPHCSGATSARIASDPIRAIAQFPAQWRDAIQAGCDGFGISLCRACKACGHSIYSVANIVGENGAPRTRTVIDFAAASLGMRIALLERTIL